MYCLSNEIYGNNIYVSSQCMCEKNALTDEEANDITYRLRKLTKLSERAIMLYSGAHSAIANPQIS
jgi:hypothetical protein